MRVACAAADALVALVIEEEERREATMAAAVRGSDESEHTRNFANELLDPGDSTDGNVWT